MGRKRKLSNRRGTSSSFTLSSVPYLSPLERETGLSGGKNLDIAYRNQVICENSKNLQKAVKMSVSTTAERNNSVQALRSSLLWSLRGQGGGVIRWPYVATWYRGSSKITDVDIAVQSRKRYWPWVHPRRPNKHSIFHTFYNYFLL